jgi:hypothetical protein
MTRYYSRLKLDKDHLNDVHRVLFEQGRITYVVKIWGTDEKGKYVKIKEIPGKFLPNYKSETEYFVENKIAGDYGFYWLVYIDTVCVWSKWADKKKLTTQLNVNDESKWAVCLLDEVNTHTKNEPRKTDVVNPKVVEISGYQIYEIDEIRATAFKVNGGELQEILNNHKDAKKNEYYIHRRSKELSKTSLETLNRINGALAIENKYTVLALSVFRRLNSQYKSSFPTNFYQIFCKDLFNTALAGAADPDAVIDGIADILGVNVEKAPNEHLSFFHVYESLVRTISSGNIGYDKVQHFTYSARGQYNKGKLITDTAQYSGEWYDAYKAKNTGEDISADSKADMYANNLGQNFGALLYEKYHPIRNYLKNLN